MNILFLTSAHNGLSQRAWLELTERGHTVSVELALNEGRMLDAVRREQPELIIAPMLKKAIPEAIWKHHTCLIVHPGIPGDRGPSSLDWAVLEGESEWGVTVLQANAEMDAGDIWSFRTFPLRTASKSSLYRQEVVEAAADCLLEAVERFASGRFQPTPLNYSRPEVKGRLRPAMKQVTRAFEWSEPTESIARKLRASDSSPGVLGALLGQELYLFGGQEEDSLRGQRPGEVLATRGDAVCVATGDGALWVSHVKPRKADEPTFKLPATLALADQLLGIPSLPLPPEAPSPGRTYREIWYEERHGVGVLYFEFCGGAMSTRQCEQLREAFLQARGRSTRVIVLMGGSDFWSNGIHLNVIEAAADPAEESWRNINAIDDLARDILLTESHLVISALRGSAGAGGVMLALAADQVFARSGIVLNPHYKSMGGLYGSEYWTYSLPRRVGEQQALELTESCLPLSTARAIRLGLLDGAFGRTPAEFHAHVLSWAEQLAHGPEYTRLLARKRRQRQEDERHKPLERYRAEELEQMRRSFFGPDRSYHEARRAFVLKIPRAGALPSQQLSRVA